MFLFTMLIELACRMFILIPSISAANVHWPFFRNVPCVLLTSWRSTSWIDGFNVFFVERIFSVSWRLYFCLQKLCRSLWRWLGKVVFGSRQFWFNVVLVNIISTNKGFMCIKKNFILPIHLLSMLTYLGTNYS